jgi:NAD+ kinase
MYLIKADNSSRELERKVVGFLKKKKIKFSYDSGDVALIIGGDDFILRVVGEFSKVVPVLGIHDGSSFFAEANSLNFSNYIELIGKKQYKIRERTRLVASVDGKKSSLALNDIGIFPTKTATLLRYSLKIDDEVFWKDTSDGIIIASPVGSTGYAFSAGGPIVLGDPDIFCLTPISSLNKSHTPVIINDNKKIVIENIEASSSVVLVLDGSKRLPVKGNKIVIEKSDSGMQFLQFSETFGVQKKLKKRNIASRVDKLTSISPSAKLVYKVLAYEGELSQKEIINESQLPSRTVRYALDVLLRSGLVEKKALLKDVRQRVYGIV